MSKYPMIQIEETFHSVTKQVQESNGWDYAYSLGYVSGKWDAQEKRRREHETKENDDYALGYHRGYKEGTP